MSQTIHWDSFHDTFAATLGFSSSGRNMQAWIDCLTARDEDNRMAAGRLSPATSSLCNWTMDERSLRVDRSSTPA